MLFYGVFEDSSIFHDGGIVMDENGRNGRKWHLAQQITQLVINSHIMQLSITIFKQQFTRHVIALSHRYGGFISIKNFPPVSNYNNLQFVNK